MTDKAQSSKKRSSQQARIAELEESLKREQAELINYKRRTEQDKIQIGTYARKSLLSQLLPIFDNIERALKAAPEDLGDHPFVKGVNGVAKQLASELESLGLERIKTVGESFDPHLHEAVAVEGEGEGDEEEIVEELQAGYKLNGEVLRHAMVKIQRS